MPRHDDKSSRNEQRTKQMAHRADLSALILRLGLGPLQIYYAAAKIPDISETSRRIAESYMLPGVFAVALVVVQILVGLGLTLGVYVRPCAALVFAASLGGALVEGRPDYGPVVLTCAISLALAVGGGRSYSVDWIRRRGGRHSRRRAQTSA